MDTTVSLKDGTPGPQAVLNFPKLDKLLLEYAKRILLAMTGNVNLPNPSPTLAVYAADVDAYDKAQTLASTKAKGTATQRNTRRRKVIDDLLFFRAYVNAVVQTLSTYADAAAVIASSGMDIRKIGRRAKGTFRARNAAIAGSVLIQANVVGHRATYYWQYSLDQKVWLNAPETMKASTVISGLTSAQTYYFRFRAITPRKAVDYSQIVSLLVH